MRISSMVAVLLGVGVLTAAAAAPAQAETHPFKCVDFSNQAQAQEFLYPGDPSDLDPDKDGIACEGLRCPCSKPSEARAGVPSPRAAERISKNLIAGLTRRSRMLQTWSFTGCNRAGQRMIGCQLGARGETIANRMVCRFRVVIEERRSHPIGHVADHRCRTTQLPHLTLRRAQRAFFRAAEAKAGPKAALGPVSLVREDALRVAGEVAWLIQPDPSLGTEVEICDLRLEARLNTKTDEVHVRSGLTLCGNP